MPRYATEVLILLLLVLWLMGWLVWPVAGNFIHLMLVLVLALVVVRLTAGQRRALP